MTTEIQIEPTGRRAIELDGIHGTFRIDECAFAIHYFSTYATPNSSEEHYRDLLEQLKPMRERVKAKDLTDLNALLQRDLSDERIATELVPYLCGKVSKVGFFPPVLAVLVPTGFIDAKDGAIKVYPTPETAEATTNYGKLWQLRYHSGSKRLARLSIFAGTEIIVLDGQHRSNAFRYVSNVLKPDDLHAVFYEHAMQPTSFVSDLPVTIAWFEGVKSQAVQPNDISRELFVAVNNNAKSVSESRTILLDDTDPVCLAVNTYYSNLAKKRGFKTGGMNLCCACFDVDVDETGSNSRPAFALTDPVSLRSATTYAFFGLDKYDSLERHKANRMPQTNKSRFERLLGNATYIDTGGGRRIRPLVNLDNRNDLRTRVEKLYVPILNSLFEKSTLVDCHHKAVKSTEDWIRGKDGTVTYVETWEKIFCGGEGLFGQIQKSESPKAATYQKAIKEIQNKFRILRRGTVRESLGKHVKFDDAGIDKAFKLFETIASQTGIVMALSVLNKELDRKGKSVLLDRQKVVCALIEEIKVEQWLQFFCAFDELYFSNLEANSWPRFQKLFVRLFCKQIDIFEKTPTWAPECEMVSWRAIEIVKAQSEIGKPIKNKEIQTTVKNAIKEVKMAFKKVDKDLIDEVNIQKAATKAVNELVAKIDRSRKGASTSPQDEAAIEENDDENGDQI